MGTQTGVFRNFCRRDMDQSEKIKVLTGAMDQAEKNRGFMAMDQAYQSDPKSDEFMEIFRQI